MSPKNNFGGGIHMIMWLIQVIILIILMKFIAEIGLSGSCTIFAVLYVIDAAVTSFTLTGILTAVITGIIAGAIAYFLAKFFLFLGEIGSFLVGILLVLAILALIF